MHNKVLKEGNFPRITFTIKGKVTLAADNGRFDHVFGLQSRFKARRNFYALRYLQTDLGLAFSDDIYFAIFEGELEIILAIAI